MSNVEEKLAKSLTAESTELIPYLPYLLQDLWELGSSPKDIAKMISQHIEISEGTKVLDLACGKGAVSVNIAKIFTFKVTGVDIIPEFIDFSKKKANEYGVGNLCDFKVADINESIEIEKDYDIAIFGAVGDVLGNAEETVEKLKNTVKIGGYIFIDDAYGKDDFNESYPSREQWLKIFDKTGVKLIDEMIINDNELENINNEQQSLIIKRANELKEKYPEKAQLFESYIKSQQAECHELENEIEGVTLLLQVI
ncbi:methyltransferase domain-containing protein [Alkaliphilus pronyensis]|uniref:Methyltransferase domain-containing protein n=1 Tax=Alkaliphilus pronyensis TaxID=1482732 RepID=A0A6I0EYZ8_9FIRM|nr:methyltransferase domain-containing protein [Alkaliphilus pronyensis]KAB3534180.1 methyltransferase domain-containing protein [Alkaliphilus pronyensis]